MVNVTKLYPTQDAAVFQAFGRVISGTCMFTNSQMWTICTIL